MFGYWKINRIQKRQSEKLLFCFMEKYRANSKFLFISCKHTLDIFNLSQNFHKDTEYESNTLHPLQISSLKIDLYLKIGSKPLNCCRRSKKLNNCNKSLKTFTNQNPSEKFSPKRLTLKINNFKQSYWISQNQKTFQFHSKCRSIQQIFIEIVLYTSFRV